MKLRNKKKPIIKVLSDTSSINDNPAHYFKEVYQTYFTHYNSKSSKKYKDIIERRYLGEETLESIGNTYGITRERVRQIVEKVKGSFNRLLRGDSIKTPRIILGVSIPHKMSKFINFVESRLVHDEKEVLDFISYTYSGKILPSDMYEYKKDIKKLMYILGYNPYKVCEKTLYFEEDSLSSSILLNEMISNIKNALKSAEKPLSLRKIVALTGIQKDCVEALLPALDFIEQLNEGYQIKNSFLNNYVDIIYRVLKNRKKPISLQEVVAELQKYNASICPRYIGARLTGDERFVSLGKKSIYSLKEWNPDGRTYLQIMEDVLRKEGKPLTTKDLHKKVLRVKKDYPLSTILSYMSSYTDIFKRLENNKVALVSWKRYKSRKRPLRKTRISSEYFLNLSLAFFISRKEKTCDTRTFYRHVKNTVRNVDSRYIYSKIKDCPILESVKGQNKIALKKGYRNILSLIAKQKNLSHKKSLKNIKEESRKYILKRGSVVMADLVKHLKTYGAASPTIYRALEDESFKKTPIPNSRTKIVNIG